MAPVDRHIVPRMGEHDDGREGEIARPSATGEQEKDAKYAVNGIKGLREGYFRGS